MGHVLEPLQHDLAERGLKPYRSKEDRIAELWNEAWRLFQSNPESYADWERTKIGELRNKFGVDA
jgi:hypothetical protein